MTIEIARRLLSSGTVTGSQIQSALLSHVSKPEPFLYALIHAGVDTQIIEKETRRADVPQLRTVSPDLNAVRQLPTSLCAQLLALPVRVDPRTSTVDVAVADPFDPHIQREFSHHLAAPVRIVLAPISVIRAALIELEEVLDAPHPLRRRKLSITKTDSELPIPLVRRSKPPPLQARPEQRSDRIGRDAILLDPGSLPAARPNLSDLSSDDSYPQSLEVVIPKSSRVPHIEELADTSPLLTHDVVGLEKALDSLQQASSRDDVVVALLQGMASVARSVGIFAVRREAFTGWACTYSFASLDEFKAVHVDRHANTVFHHAALEGWFFGTIPRTDEHRQLLAFLDDPDQEVAIFALRLLGRPAMLIFVTQWVDVLVATRTAERLGNASAKALLRVLRAEKFQDR